MSSDWVFVIGAYAAAAIGTVGLFAASYLTMRRAEREAAALRERK
jgi:hypothetical protein